MPQSRGLAFDNSVVLLPNDVLEGATDFTLQFGLRHNDPGQNIGGIIAASNVAEPDAFLVSILGSSLRVENNNQISSFALNGQFDDGEWHDVTVVRDQTGSRVEVYIDGVSIGSDTLGLSSINLAPEWPCSRTGARSG